MLLDLEKKYNIFQKNKFIYTDKFTSIFYAVF